MKNYVVSSLELHLFFTRIMKEYAYFLEIGFTKAETKSIERAAKFKDEFLSLLDNVVKNSEGIVRNDVIKSGELITEITLMAETRTAQLTGVDIDTKITSLESKLQGNDSCDSKNYDKSLIMKIKFINRRSLELISHFISFVKWMLNQVLCCKMYTSNYPILIQHIIREAELYRMYIYDLEFRYGKEQENFQKSQLFWNQSMMEHALIIRGRIDPGETQLISLTDGFVCEFEKLRSQAYDINQTTLKAVTDATIGTMSKFRNFITDRAKEINECQIRSLMIPLYTDHVWREVNHYIRILTK